MKVYRLMLFVMLAALLLGSLSACTPPAAAPAAPAATQAQPAAGETAAPAAPAEDKTDAPALKPAPAVTPR